MRQKYLTRQRNSFVALSRKSPVYKKSVDGGLIRVIDDRQPKDPAYQLALEESISRMVRSGSSPITVRFWQNPPSIIIGRSQSVESEVDIQRTKQANIPVIRRPTGGGTVIHHRENLNYSIYLPEPKTGDIHEEQRRWAEPLISSLRSIGLPAEYRENGLYLGGKKISGIAESRRWGLLHHGTLLLGMPPEFRDIKRWLKAPRDDYRKPSSGVASRPSPVTSLETESSKEIALSKLLRNWIAELSKALDGDAREGKVTPRETKFARHLRQHKYSDLNWNQSLRE